MTRVNEKRLFSDDESSISSHGANSSSSHDDFSDDSDSKSSLVSNGSYLASHGSSTLASSKGGCEVGFLNSLRAILPWTSEGREVSVEATQASNKHLRS